VSAFLLLLQAEKAIKNRTGKNAFLMNLNFITLNFREKYISKNREGENNANYFKFCEKLCKFWEKHCF
jgi:hypothetical protein